MCSHLLAFGNWLRFLFLGIHGCDCRSIGKCSILWLNFEFVIRTWHDRGMIEEWGFPSLAFLVDVLLLWGSFEVCDTSISYVGERRDAVEGLGSRDWTNFFVIWVLKEFFCFVGGRFAGVGCDLNICCRVCSIRPIWSLVELGVCHRVQVTLGFHCGWYLSWFCRQE